MSKVVITHPGIIKNLTSNKAEVSIIVNSSCASCEVKSSCSISDAKEKIIEISLSPSDKYEMGQHVMVEMKQSMGSWAVLIGYFFPFLFVLIGLIVFTSVGIDEGISALLSLSILIPYYLVLYLTRDILSKRFTYSMEPN